MKITKEEDSLVLRIPLKQHSYDAGGDLRGDVANLIGIIAGTECSISFLNDLGYKDDIQEGMPVVVFADEKELIDACEKLGLDVWRHEICANCKRIIYGTYEYTEKGNICMSCEK